jgi:Holliday junction resolvase-like predicted endonuclease
MWGIGRLFRVPARKAVTSSGDLGRQGEEIARRYLTRQGYRVVVAGFTTPIGRSRGGRQVRAEIDLIAWDESQSPSTLAFIEVIRRMVRVENEAFRYDVVSIIIREQGAVPEIALLKNYFHE